MVRSVNFWPHMAPAQSSPNRRSAAPASLTSSVEKLYPGLRGLKRREAIKKDFALDPKKHGLAARILPYQIDANGKALKVVVKRHPLNDRHYAQLVRQYADMMLKLG